MHIQKRYPEDTQISYPLDFQGRSISDFSICIYFPQNIYATKKNPAPHFLVRKNLIQCLDCVATLPRGSWPTLGYQWLRRADRCCYKQQIPCTKANQNRKIAVLGLNDAQEPDRDETDGQGKISQDDAGCQVSTPKQCGGQLNTWVLSPKRE